VSERRTFPRPPQRSGGFTMVELLVAVTLGLFLLGGVLSIFVNSRQSFRVNENMARVQENARFSFDVLSREIREAGNVPCGTRFMANVVDVPASLPWWANWDAGVVRGFNEDQDTAPRTIGTAEGDRVAGTDAIIVLRPVSDESSIQPVSAHDTATKKITVTTGSAFAAGNLVTLCDSRSAVLLKVVSVATNDLSYATTNCSVNLGYPTGVCSVASPAKTFAAGSTVTEMDPAFWYVGKNASGGSSLYRMRLKDANPTSGAAATETQEMVSNVTDMQIEYLTRNPASVPALATAWVTAKAIADGDGWTTAAAKQVVAVRLTLTLQSEEKVGTDGNAVQRKYVSVSSLRSRDLP
jgi:type IV pilus assembly protein PilW